MSACNSSSRNPRAIKKDHGPFSDDQWEKLLRQGDSKSRQCNEEGSIAYNVAIIVMIGGLFCAIAAYDLVVASVVAFAGYSLEVLQMIR
jgi:hypothetical protein